MSGHAFLSLAVLAEAIFFSFIMVHTWIFKCAASVVPNVYIADWNYVAICMLKQKSLICVFSSRSKILC